MRQELLRSTQKEWLAIDQAGFLLVEVILASAVFALLITGLVGAYLYGQESTALAGNRARAVMLAEEGLEAVRNIRDASFGNLTDGTYGLTTTGNQWNLSGFSDISDIFTRQIVISAVDPKRKSVTANVTWQQNPQRSGSVVLSSRLTYWQAIVSSLRSMMVYSKLATNNTPFYRIWDGSASAWGAESSATNVGNNIQYLVLKFARNTGEAILGTLDQTGNIRVQIWNGSSWSATTLLANVGTTNDAYRGFDIEYETSGNRAIVVYNNANSADPAYRIWNGTSWSLPVIMSTPPTTGAPLWIELERNPLSASNEIAMMLLDANADVYGMAWDGSSWSTMGTAAVWDATTAISTKKIIDIAYEQLTGRAMFMWGDSVATDQRYRLWNGSTLTAATLLDIPASAGVAAWIRLVARPNSNELLYGVQDAGADLNTRRWSGSAWDSATEHPEHDATTENITSRNFDLIYETYPANSGKAFLVWGNGATVSGKQWSGTIWGAAAVLPGSDDTSFVSLHSDPTTGAIFAAEYQSRTSATDDLHERHLVGGSASWSSVSTIWAGQVVAEPVMFRVNFDTER